MTWDALAAIADLLAAMGVIGSVIYLAFQIRQNTLSNRITAKQNTTDQFVSFGNLMMENEELRDIWRKGRASMDELSEEELELFHYLNMNFCWYYGSQHFQYRHGAMDEVDWAQSLGLIRGSWLEGRGVRAWWKNKLDQRRLTKPFFELIEAEIRSIEHDT